MFLCRPKGRPLCDKPSQSSPSKRTEAMPMILWILAGIGMAPSAIITYWAVLHAAKTVAEDVFGSSESPQCA